jgi:hypothetical protein
MRQTDGHPSEKTPSSAAMPNSEHGKQHNAFYGEPHSLFSASAINTHIALHPYSYLNNAIADETLTGNGTILLKAGFLLLGASLALGALSFVTHGAIAIIAPLVLMGLSLTFVGIVMKVFEWQQQPNHTNMPPQIPMNTTGAKKLRATPIKNNTIKHGDWNAAPSKTSDLRRGLWNKLSHLDQKHTPSKNPGKINNPPIEMSPLAIN